MFRLFSFCSKMSARQQFVAIIGRSNSLRGTSLNYSPAGTCSSRIRSFVTTGVAGIGETWPERRESKTNKWNRAVAEADTHLGFPSILASQDALLGIGNPAEIMEMSRQLRRIFGTSHPLIKTAKTVVYSGQQNMQIRGLITLLWAKGLAELSGGGERDKAIVKKESYLATLTELFHIGLMIHRSIVDVEKVYSEEDIEVGHVRHANKLTIIIGDLLFAKANLLLGKMENPSLSYDFAESVLDYTEGAFMLESDKHGQTVPLEKMTFQNWETISFKKNGSLLANSLKALHILNGLSERTQNAYDYGKNFCMAWKASLDIQTYVNEPRRSNEPFSLISLPVVLQMEKDHSLMKELVTPHREDLSKVDFQKIRELVTNGETIQEARNKCSEYVVEAQKHLQTVLPQSKTREILQNMLSAHEI